MHTQFGDNVNGDYCGGDDCNRMSGLGDNDNDDNSHIDDGDVDEYDNYDEDNANVNTVGLYETRGCLSKNFLKMHCYTSIVCGVMGWSVSEARVKS